MRLNRFIASCGFCSRRKADMLIEAGRVTCNGQVVTLLGTVIDETRDTILVDGVRLQLPSNKTYLMLHKPVGFITTMHDDRGRVTIYHLLPKKFSTLRPVGRLDADSSGLLLLSNDGDFIQRLSHPSSNVAKTYIVTARGLVSKLEIIKMRQGMRLPGEKQLARANAALLDYQEATNVSKLKMVLTQGLNREIRKMLALLGHEVITLKRIAQGRFKLGSLKEGAWRLIKSH